MSNTSRIRRLMGETDHNRAAVNAVFVIGLGRFGSALAEELMTLGVEVMAVDVDQRRVDQFIDRVTHARVADATDTVALQQLAANNFDVAVVAIGTGIEASLLATAALLEVGVERIWAKALSDEHGRILSRIGAHHVVYPEQQMGERVAHLVSGQVLDYFELDEGFVLAEISTPDDLVGVRLGDTDIRSRFDVTVVCIKPVGGRFTYATVDTVLDTDDVLLIAGETAAAARFVGHARK